MGMYACPCVRGGAHVAALDSFGAHGCEQGNVSVSCVRMCVRVRAYVSEAKVFLLWLF